MITNLHEFFNHDFSNIENQLVDLIKHGWVLVCVLTGGRENVLMKYCGKLREKFGTEYGQTLNDLYFNDTEQFKALFSANAIKLALGLR